MLLIGFGAVAADVLGIVIAILIVSHSVDVNAQVAVSANVHANVSCNPGRIYLGEGGELHFVF